MQKNNINTKEYWNNKWQKGSKRHWIVNKKRYQILSLFFPHFILKAKIKKKYYLEVAKIASGSFCDLGCGNGIVNGLYNLLSGKNSFGMDFSLEGIKKACQTAIRYKLSCTFFVGDIFYTPLKSNIFDTVYIGQVLEHLKNEREALNEGIRILKPGGKLIISVPNSQLKKDKEHINFYNKERIIDILTKFKVNDPALKNGAFRTVVKDINFNSSDPKRYIVSCIKYDIFF